MINNVQSRTSMGKANTIVVVALGISLMMAVFVGVSYAEASLSEDEEEVTNIDEEDVEDVEVTLNSAEGESVTLEEAGNIINFGDINHHNIDERQEELDVLSNMTAVEIDINSAGMDWGMEVDFAEEEGEFTSRLDDEDLSNMEDEWIDEEELEEYLEEQEE